MKTHFYIILAIWVILTTNKAFAQSHITVLPGTTVEVGEEVYFDAVYYSNRISDTLQFEWDFGDGYFLGAGKPALYTFETGLCAIHYFMRPGIFKVKMTASSFDMSTEIPARKNILAVDSVLITVTGETPLAGFELWHAPFHARTAQYLYAIVPDGYSPSQVVARVERVGGGYSQELTGTTVNNKQRFLLNTASLPSGDYVLTAELINGETVVSRIREKFSKPYEGAPTVGINEKQCLCSEWFDSIFPTSTLYAGWGLYSFMATLFQCPSYRRLL
ncbi:MAG: PKD domain-containing protein [Rhodocyclaceae bacterium]|nr:PKD domain-containing protein [Rhodocyclaceae bacterium]